MLSVLRLAVVVVALAGAALANGVVKTPAAVTGLRADVERWQVELSDRLICRRRAIEALTTEDEQQLAAAEAVCERVD